MRVLSGLILATAVATAVTVAIAWPVIVAPTSIVFGSQLVGRHYDPFVVMFQMAGVGASGPYVQPVTDGLGWLFARAMPVVAAYNLLVLGTFPLAAAATYGLFRYVSSSHGGALVAALAFAFAPIHLAQAAYHPHVAQVQWIPLYLLALFAAIDHPSRLRLLGLAAATGTLVLSNYYAGLMGIVVTPVALVSYWGASPRAGRRPRHLWAPATVLLVLGVIGAAVAVTMVPRLFATASPYAFPAADVTRYSARWWAYLTPPLDHGVLGRTAAAAFASANIGVGVIEQQVFVGFALLTLAGVATVQAVARWRSAHESRALIALMAVGLAAAVVSVGPGGQPCTPGSWVPACRMHELLPMFRAYARLGVVVQLVVAIAAGAGVAWLGARRSPVGRAVATALLAIALFEYWPLPWRSHDVLPTLAHRWVAEEPALAGALVLDCVPRDGGTPFNAWLMQRHTTQPPAAIESCQSPQLGGQLAALGYTHVLVLNGPRAPVLDREDEFRRVRTLSDSTVFAVTARVPTTVVLGSRGFYPLERVDDDVWRWMGPEGEWTVRNTTDRAQHVALDIALQAFGRPRHLRVTIDDAPAGAWLVGTENARYVLGPWLLAPGDHRMTLASDEPAARPSDHGGSSDDRLLTVAVRNATWLLQERLAP